MLPDTHSEQPLLVENNEGNEYAEYIRILIGKKWLILSATIVVSIVSIIYFSMRPNLYTAAVKILVEESQENLKSYQDSIGTSYRAQKDYYGTQIALLTGRDVTRVVEEELSPLPGYGVWAQQIRETRIIILYVKDRNPQAAADIANKFAEVYVKESSKQNLYVSEQFLKLIPEDGELFEGSPEIDKLKGFNKKEFAESLSSVMNDPVVQKMRAEKLDLQAKLKEASSRYKPQHPTMIDLNERLSFVEGELKDRTKKILNNLRAKLAGEIAITNIRILEKALPPKTPSEPNRSRGILTCTLAALFLSCGLVIFMETTSQKIRTEQDLRPWISLPFLGYIPRVRELEVGKKPDKGGAATPKEAVSVIDVLAKNTILADAVASVRTHILFSMPYERSKRIMVTSTLPDEGKSTVATLLALSLVAMGRKVLLVEADMRRPFVHRFLKVENGKGLTDFLIGSVSSEEIIRPVPNTTLKIVTAGSETPNPSELLASERFKNFLDKASQDFDRVVIDIAPVLYIPDGLIVAKYVHSGILVCGANMVTKKIVQKVKEKFDAIGHSFIGIIINRADYEKEGYKYEYFGTYKKYYSSKKPELLKNKK